MGAPRYALYWAPDRTSALWRFGCSVLGYDAETGDGVPYPQVRRLAGRWSAITEAPRVYGFHATLKAPFSLADGVSEADLVAETKAFALGRLAFVVPSLHLTRLSTYVALCPRGRPPALHAFADEVVAHFDRFRAPLSAADRARRQPDRLSERQRNHLDRWGYPQVFEDFKAHLSLVGPLGAHELDDAVADLGDIAPSAPDLAEVLVNDLTIFKQEAATSRFRILARCPLRAAGGG